MRYAWEASEPVRDRVVTDPGCTSRRGRGCRVLAIVRAGDPRLRRQRIVARELDAARFSGDGAEAGGEHGRVARLLPLEQPQLRVSVLLEAAVPVEMVGLEVEQDADARPERVHVLELERGELEHEPGAVRRLEPADRCADVAGDLDGYAAGTEDLADELGGRRLAVRAGDADDRARREEPRAQLDLAPHRESGRPRSADERRLAGHPRALHQHVGAIERGRRDLAQPDLGPGLGQLGRVQPLVAIDRDDLHPAPPQRQRRRAPRPSQAEDHRSPHRRNWR